MWFYQRHWFAGRRRLVAQPGGLTFPVVCLYVCLLWQSVQTETLNASLLATTKGAEMAFLWFLLACLVMPNSHTELFCPWKIPPVTSLLNLLTGYTGVCLLNCYGQKRFLLDMHKSLLRPGFRPCRFPVLFTVISGHSCWLMLAFERTLK